MKRATILSACVVLSVPALAAANEAEDGAWHFTLAPWFWAAGTGGTVSVLGAPEVPLDMSFGDTWENLDFAIQTHFEARRNRFGVGTDLLYVNLGVPVAEGRPVLGRLDLEVDLRQTQVEGFGFYRLARGGSRPENPAYLEGLAGIRYVDTNTKIVGDEFEGTKRALDWVDGFVGLRGSIPLSDSFALMVRTDVAFFGSDLTWNVNGDVRWRFAERWYAGLGYRYLDIDYENDDVAYKPTMKGPYVGVAYRW